MKKTYEFEGIDCPNCALKLENKLTKIKGIDKVSINFFFNSIDVEYSSDDALTKLVEICNNFEDGVKIYEV